MAQKKMMQPTLVMETSWEVCNKVGGIYTVLSTRAHTMVKELGEEGVLFIGPLLRDAEQPDFLPDESRDDTATQLSALAGLEVRLGKWNVPGNPLCALVDYQPLFEQKSELYYQMWQAYGIEGQQGYGDYDHSVLFAIATAKVMMAYLALFPRKRPLALFNEWTCGMGLLYLQQHLPHVTTSFITHATTVGRSIAGNGKDLYSYMSGYNGNQMAAELGVVAKHAVERSAAQRADAFGTVSEVTDVECTQLLERPVDVVVYNGFEQGFIPTKKVQAEQRKAGREQLLHLASKLYGKEVKKDALIVITSGRNEYRNKGLDIFVDAMRRLSGRAEQVVALIAVPGWVHKPRPELQWALKHNAPTTMPMQQPYLTHLLHEPWGNRILSHLEGLHQEWGENVFPILLPAYLDGNDGILNIPYYQLLPAIDLSVFASYYEPWGYTPLESIAFGVPTITTDKAGFGQWARSTMGGKELEEGVLVLDRHDDNFEEVASLIAESITTYAKINKAHQNEARKRASALAKEADWAHFYPRYQALFAHALSKKS